MRNISPFSDLTLLHLFASISWHLASIKINFYWTSQVWRNTYKNTTFLSILFEFPVNEAFYVNLRRWLLIVYIYLKITLCKYNKTVLFIVIFVFNPYAVPPFLFEYDLCGIYVWQRRYYIQNDALIWYAFIPQSTTIMSTWHNLSFLALIFEMILGVDRGCKCY